MIDLSKTAYLYISDMKYMVGHWPSGEMKSEQLSFYLFCGSCGSPVEVPGASRLKMNDKRQTYRRPTRLKWTDTPRRLAALEPGTIDIGFQFFIFF